MAPIDVEKVLLKLTDREKLSLLAGIDFWHTKSLPQYGIKSLRLSDGPNGVRGTRFFNSVPAACLPCGTALGSTFDKDLIYEAGKLMGEEAKAKGSHVLLGPTVNMQRSPLGGRGFESYSEDPVLAGLVAASFINGIQSHGIVAAIKHFVANDQEHERNKANAIITERALRELYLLPFQLAIRESKPKAIMTSYNKVNGVHVAEDKKLLQQVLRRERGWKGLVMSDWFGTYSTPESINAGLDLEMPGPTRWRGEAAFIAHATDKLDPDALDDCARAVLNLVNECESSSVPENAKESTRDTPETSALLRRLASESIVLLKNENNVLPLNKNKKTLVIGPNANNAVFCGGGSAALRPYRAVTPLDGIRSKVVDAEVAFSVGAYSHRELPDLALDLQLTPDSEKRGVTFTAFNDAPEIVGRTPVDTLQFQTANMMFMDYNNPALKELWYANIEGYLVAERDGDFDLGLCVYGSAQLFVNGDMVIDVTENQRQGSAFLGCGTEEDRATIRLEKGETYHIKLAFASAPTSLNKDWESEGFDRDDMHLPPNLDKLTDALLEANPQTVVVMQSGTPVEMPWLQKASGLLQAWYGGNETGNGIADVLFGDVNPSGKLSLSFPIHVEDNPAYLNYRSEAGRVLYGEDVYIGYRWYEALKKPVNFPFGFGLSYTKFKLECIQAQVIDETLVGTASVTNVGARDGAQVIQAYVSQEAPSIRRPPKELKDFCKVVLKSGETQQVQFKIPIKYVCSYFDERKNQWICEKGTYHLGISDSSQFQPDNSLLAKFDVKETFWWKGL